MVHTLDRRERAEYPQAGPPAVPRRARPRGHPARSRRRAWWPAARIDTPARPMLAWGAEGGRDGVEAGACGRGLGPLGRLARVAAPPAGAGGDPLLRRPGGEPPGGDRPP